MRTSGGNSFAGGWTQLCVQRHRVHGATTERLTLLGVDDHRGVDGIKALGVLGKMTGIVITTPARRTGMSGSTR